MKKILNILFGFSLILALALPAVNASAHPAQQITTGSKLVVGGVYALNGGETLDGDLLVLGGNASLLSGSTRDR